jgi:hypothetical protein
VCFGLGVLKPLRAQARFLRLQAPVIRMDQKWGHGALPHCRRERDWTFNRHPRIDHTLLQTLTLLFLFPVKRPLPA